MTSSVPRPLLVLTGLLLVARVAAGVHEARRGPHADTTVKWRPASAALVEAEEDGRPVLYDFSADWCRPCRAMHRDVFADPVHGPWIESRYVPVLVEDGFEADGLSDEEARALRERFGVEGFPTLLVVRGDEVLARQVGYPGLEGTLAFLQRGDGAPR